MKTLQYATTIHVPVEKIDLYAWLVNISEKDYQRFSEAHIAIGMTKRDGTEGMVNVESIGGNLLIQHYSILTKEKGHVFLRSAKSDAYLFHLIKVHISVEWRLKVIYRDEQSCAFTCSVGVAYPNSLLAIALKLSFVNFFLKRHLDEEGRNFARDIERTFQAGKHILLTEAEAVFSAVV